jgi:hypothetical protein
LSPPEAVPDTVTKKDGGRAVLGEGILGEGHLLLSGVDQPAVSGSTSGPGQGYLCPHPRMEPHGQWQRLPSCSLSLLHSEKLAGTTPSALSYSPSAAPVHTWQAVSNLADTSRP